MNDFESILARMKANLSGVASTLEGTFAGDLLQAAATELARIWSQDMDTAANRSFVTTAEGTWLDAACADYGITRKNEESDQQLRERTLNKIRQQAASGNAADYIAWAEAMDGVSAACAIPLARGAGTVDVYFVPEDGAAEDLTQRVSAAIEQRRPVGADVAVAQAQAVSVAVTAVVSLTGETTAEGAAAAFEYAFSAYLQQVRLRPQGGTVRPSRVVSLLMALPGVEDVSGVTLNGSAQPLTLSAGQYAVCGSSTLTEAPHA